MGKGFWSEEEDVVERAAPEDVGGYRADTDDVLGDVEFGENLVDPERQSRKTPGGVGGGPAGMMPPAMGMAQGGGMNAGARGVTAAGGVTPTGAAGVGHAGVTPSGGVATGASAGAGGLVGGAGGSVAGGGTVAAGSSGRDYGFGVNPATGRPWSSSDPGFTERFGVYDPATGKYVNPVTGVVYDPVTGSWTRPGAGSGVGVSPGTGSGAGVDPGSGVGTGSGGVGPGIGGVGGSGHTAPAVDGGVHGVFPAPGGLTGGAHGSSADGGLVGGGVSGSVGGWGGGEYDVGDMSVSGRRWDDLTGRMDVLKGRIDEVSSLAGFGLAAHCQGSYGGAVGTASHNVQGSGSSMTGTATNLVGSAGDYAATEQENAALGVKVVGK